MHKLTIYNSLTKKQQKFVSIKKGKVGLYTCGPTIYDYPTIGNYRTYVLSDLIVKTLQFIGYKVNYVMNLTDVGHLSGDNLGDADTGEDRMAKAAKKQGINAYEVASKYQNDFLNSFKWLNLQMPNTVAKATDHIKEQINLISQLQSKGLTYVIDDGVYFNVKKYEQLGYKYGQLSDIDKQKKSRIAPNKQKKDKRDFALWKFFATGQKRHNMEWNSPWGVGFPGWHIECSAMSTKYLGEHFDIHIGGEDLKQTHHPNEIAQSQGASGKKFVNYWIHGAFLLVNGGKMGKSLGNAYTLHDLKAKKYNLLALRYFYLTGHYQKQINFTFKALNFAQKSLNNLYTDYKKIAEQNTNINKYTSIKTNKYYKQFVNEITSNFNFPNALAVLHSVINSNEKPSVKLALLNEFDKVLSLGFSNLVVTKPIIHSVKVGEENLKIIAHQVSVNKKIKDLVVKRHLAKKNKNYSEADKLRAQLNTLGIDVKDTKNGIELYSS